MKAVMISIRPEWCEKIASGRKTIEVRKTRPKLETPFKCYIYCTKDNTDIVPSRIWWKADKTGFQHIMNGKVIGEFVCDAIWPICVKYSDPNHRLALRPCPYTCLTDKQIMDYLGNGVTGYGWHISELKIYDKPKDISEFITPSEVGCCNEGKCRGCHYLDRGNGFNIEDDCTADFDTDNHKPLRKPPQSWCYVEEQEA